MAIKSLAIKYRPTTFDDVSEQGAVKTILTQQLEAGETKNAYLFCGGAGTGKTTCARIFAREINHGEGNPIEMDAASNSSVEDVRSIIQQAQTKSLDSEYKVFIIDECHSISNTGWQAFLKLIEEPPAKSIFIFCTTDPQKIPKTILSRVQRYDFQRISQQGIVDRLHYILDMEFENKSFQWHRDSLEYIAKLADGGMRDAITLLDKCLAYSEDLALENVVKALGEVDYDLMFALAMSIICKFEDKVIYYIEYIHSQGKDLKQFMRSFMNFVLDVNKYLVFESFDYISIPNYCDLSGYKKYAKEFRRLLDVVVKLNADVKWDTAPKYLIEATFMIEVNHE